MLKKSGRQMKHRRSPARIRIMSSPSALPSLGFKAVRQSDHRNNVVDGAGGRLQTADAHLDDQTGSSIMLRLFGRDEHVKGNLAANSLQFSTCAGEGSRPFLPRLVSAVFASIFLVSYWG